MAVDKNKIIAEATKHVQKGALDKAIQTYQRILAEDPKDVRILLKVAELHQKKGDARAAAAAFERVAQSYADQGFFLKSVAVYKQIAKLDPDDVRVNEKLAGLYQQLGLVSDAMGQYQFMATAYEKAGDGAKLTEVLERMVQLDPENIASSIKLGELYARGGQAAPALECFRRATDYLKKHNRTDEYLKVAERLAALSPDDVALTRELANAYLAKRDTKRALAKLQLCFKADPKDVDTLHLLAQAFRDLGQSAKTLSVYKELARVQEERGRSEEARAAWRKVQELAPGDEEAAIALGGGARPAAARPPPAGPPPGARAPPPGPPPGARAPQPAGAPPKPDAAPPPQAAAGRDAIPKLLSETDVYVKYGLLDRALEHLARILAIEPLHADALERARELHATAGRTAEGGRFGAQAVRAFAAAGELDRAGAALARLQELAPDFPELDELAMLVGGTEEVELVDGEPEEEVVLSAVEDAEDAALPDEDALALAAATAGGEEVVDEDEPSAAREEDLVEDDETAPAPTPSARPPAQQRPGSLPVRGAAPAARTPPPAAPAATPARTPPPAAPAAGPARTPPPVAQPVAAGPARTPPPGAPAAAAPARTPAPVAPAGAGPARTPPPVAPAAAPARARPSAAAPARPAAPVPALEDDEVVDLSDEIEEADFFVQQGLLDDAREALENLLAFYPGHPAVEAKLAELGRAGGGAAPDEASLDIARDLAELGGGPEAEPAEDEFQYSVEDVFNQFKQAVQQTVRPEDSATHYDLGIAYKEMGLLDDAIHEFETALQGNDRKREVDCLSMVGVCQIAKGDGAAAVATFRRALASDHLTRDAAGAIHYELGAAHELAGDREAALYYFQKAATADPTFRDVARRVAELGGGPGRAPPDERPEGAPARPPPPAARPAAASPAAPKKNIGYL